MLSRVADNLYWMARYIERVENMARLIDVNLQLMLDLPQIEAQRLKKDWQAILVCLDLKKNFLKKHSNFDCKAVTEFLVIAAHPYSIFNQIKLARENARAIREEISTEMWEQLNRVYLWSISRSAFQLFLKNPYDFFYRIKQESHLFQGITDATLPHREAWRFIQLGKYSERAEKTSCFLDNQLFHASDSLLGWIAVLRSCSARQAYQKCYQTLPQPRLVVKFLCHDPFFPRSIAFCLNQIKNLLEDIAKEHGATLQTLILFRDLKTLLKQAKGIYPQHAETLKLHQELKQFQLHLDNLNKAIFKTYLYYQAPTKVSLTPQ